jgi:ABC-type multidrug transport system ATPase subunit
MFVPAIKIQRLSKSFKHIPAVDGLNLTVPAGEIFGFLGPNGAGKSTTLRMLLTLIRPTSGSIDIFGLPLHAHRKEALANIGSIIEKPDFYLYLTGTQNLWLLAKLHGLTDAGTRITRLLDLVGLAGRGNHLVKTYSHGMKQRLGIAQALLHDPKLIILDEPTTGLDPQGIIELRYLLLKLKNEQGKTIVLSSHILPEVELIADSMVIMHQGKAVAQGKVANLLSSEKLIVKVETDNPLAAKIALQETALGHQLTADDPASISLTLSRKDIPELIHLLTDKSIAVFGISYQRPLEEYFLKITQNTVSYA